MNLNLFALTAFLTITISVAAANNLNAGQPTGSYGLSSVYGQSESNSQPNVYSQPNIRSQRNCDCDPNCNCEVSCCYKLWRCMYGQMVNDGTGNTFRLYGYPKPPCCCKQPCGYPTWGMGNSCFPECHGHPHRCRHDYGYPNHGFGALLPTRCNGSAVAWCAMPQKSCSAEGSDNNIVQATHRTAQPKPKLLPRGLKLASSPTPIRLER